MAETLIDSYSETNKDAISSLYSGRMVSQSFTGTALKLSSCKFYLVKSGAPTGNMTARLYAHSGTFGTSSVPTGSILAESGNLDVSTFTGSYTLYILSFTGANMYKLTDGTKYCIISYYSGGDAGNFVGVGLDNSSPSHGGNWALYTGSWSADNAYDTCFYVYGTPVPVAGVGIGNPLMI